MTRENSKPLKVTLTGSYRKDPAGLDRDYRELVRNQCQVLSPRSLDFIDSTVLFVRTKVEEDESSHSIQCHHLQAIALSDFVWLHAPNGYVGLSGAMEIGYAVSRGVPIFSSEELLDENLNSFVTKVPSVFLAIEQLPS